MEVRELKSSRPEPGYWRCSVIAGLQLQQRAAPGPASQLVCSGPAAHPTSQWWGVAPVGGVGWWWVWCAVGGVGWCVERRLGYQVCRRV